MTYFRSGFDKTFIIFNNRNMKYSQAKQGRIFIVRLENGDVVHESIQKIARKENIHSAAVVILGAADKGSWIISGPEESPSGGISPIKVLLDNVHEISGTGTIFPDSSGNPVLHMHIACGRGEDSVVGCVREGVKIWQVAEVVIMELEESSARRIKDESSVFELLHP